MGHAIDGVAFEPKWPFRLWFVTEIVVFLFLSFPNCTLHSFDRRTSKRTLTTSLCGEWRNKTKCEKNNSLKQILFCRRSCLNCRALSAVRCYAFVCRIFLFSKNNNILFCGACMCVRGSDLLSTTIKPIQIFLLTYFALSECRQSISAIALWPRAIA